MILIREHVVLNFDWVILDEVIALYSSHILCTDFIYLEYFAVIRRLACCFGFITTASMACGK